MTAGRHLLAIDDLDPAALAGLLDAADACRGNAAALGRPLTGRHVGLLFEKPSTRTRVSTEVAAAALGAYPVVLSAAELQLGRGEPLPDTARVLSSYLDAICVRTFGQDRLAELAANSAAPVLNLLSDAEHPLQALADLQTIRARCGGLAGRAVAWVGDGNNVAASLAKAAAMSGMHVRLATPAGYNLHSDVLATARALAQTYGGSVEVAEDAVVAVAGADVVATDVWASMGQEDQAEQRLRAFAGYTVDDALLDHAGEGAFVLHCLPAHRGEEITAAVIDGPRSAVWEQAANRLPTAMAALAWLLASTDQVVAAEPSPAGGAR